jgi:C_GCAxxG_C_C family probable redox protein
MEKKMSDLSRRHFLGCVSYFLASGGLIRVTGSPQTKKVQTRKFWGEFSEEEQKMIDQSVLANDIENFAGKGYSCAESVLMVSLRYLGKPEEMVHAAAGFGGGLGQGDLCGLLTGGIMAIGISAGIIHEDREKLKEAVRKSSNEYWNWWKSWAPLHCAELRPLYSGREEYLRMGKRVAAKLEELIKPAQGRMLK